MCKKNCAGKKQTILTPNTTVWLCTHPNIQYVLTKYNIYPGWMLDFWYVFSKVI